jgi:hypothetical protein
VGWCRPRPMEDGQYRLVDGGLHGRLPRAAVKWRVETVILRKGFIRSGGASGIWHSNATAGWEELYTYRAVLSAKILR